MDEDEALRRVQAADPAEGWRASEEKAQKRALRAARLNRSPTLISLMALLLVGTGAASGWLISRAGGPNPDFNAVGPVMPPMIVPEGEPASMGRGSDSLLNYSGERVIFKAGELPEDAGTRPVWGYDPSESFNEETIRKIADALGVAGEPELGYGAWNVTSEDGVNLSLQPDASGSLSYYNSHLDPYVCFFDEPGASMRTEKTTASIEAPVDLTQVEPAPQILPGETCGTSEKMSSETMQAKTLELLEKLGQGSQWEVSTDGGGAYSSTAKNTTDGRTWSFTWGEEDVANFYGPIAPLVNLGEYPVVGAKEAVTRLSDPRFGGSRVYDEVASATPMLAPDPSQEAYPEGEPTLPPAPAAGLKLPWEVAEVTLSNAKLVTSPLYGENGEVLLVPYWRLSTAEGESWEVLAVSEESLKM